MHAAAGRHVRKPRGARLHECSFRFIAAVEGQFSLVNTDRINSSLQPWKMTRSIDKNSNIDEMEGISNPIIEMEDYIADLAGIQLSTIMSGIKVKVGERPSFLLNAP